MKNRNEMNDGKTSEYINNFSKAKKEILKGVEERRPKNPDECNSLTDANKWRLTVMIELSDYIRIIQNAALGESKIRILNDTINEYLKLKDAWEDRIKSLGGENWKELKSEIDETCFKHGDYTYWGAARYLPGVKELFTKQTQLIDVKTDKNFSKEYVEQKYKLNSNYYGENYENKDILMEENLLEGNLRNNCKNSIDKEFNKFLEINSWYTKDNLSIFNNLNNSYSFNKEESLNYNKEHDNIFSKDNDLLEEYVLNSKKNEIIEKILLS